MLDNWLFVGLMLVVAIGFPIVPILVARLIGPSRPNRIKSETYECGIETVGETWVQFKVQYYIYALVFLIFDIEAVFLFPWAVAFDQLALFAVVEGIIFIIILFGGLLYAWNRGILEWV
ncbi:MAG TPA: NADH-quinone oxidoreductase subunit A [Anaerolineales bacterium]|nr:NADH-quinone oxidoreductase subunit A [Anaerolineales bacterium]